MFADSPLIMNIQLMYSIIHKSLVWHTRRHVNIIYRGGRVSLLGNGERRKKVKKKNKGINEDEFHYLAIRKRRKEEEQKQ